MQSAYEHCGAPPKKGALASISNINLCAQQASTPVCRFWNVGCRAGASCRFIHPDQHGRGTSQEQCSPIINDNNNVVSIKLGPSSLSHDPVRDLSFQSSFSKLSNASLLPNDPTSLPSDSSPKSESSPTGSSWDDETLSPASSSSWDDPSHDVKTPQLSSAVRSRNGIVSLRPLPKATGASTQQSSQDIRSGATPKVTRNDYRSNYNVVTTSTLSRSHHFSKHNSNRNQREAIYESKSERYLSTHPSVPNSSSRPLSQRAQVPSQQQRPQCELVAPDGIADSLPVLASIRGYDLKHVRHQLSLCFDETYPLLFNETTWAFFLPQGAVFSLELEKSQRGPKSKTPNAYRLFGKPLSPLKQTSNSVSVTFMLRTFEENALSVLIFLEKVLCVAFFERDANPDQSSWNRERLPNLDERIKVFLAKGHVTVETENFRALVPRCADDGLEIDSETKRSTVAALSRLSEEPALPPRQLTLPAKVEQPESETTDDEGDFDEEEVKCLVNGDVCTYSGYTLTVTQDHAEKQRILASCLQKRSCVEPLILRSHYTALGPETCLKFGPAARVLVSSPLTATAGCSHSSQISEALSAQLLLNSYDLGLHHTEMELEYVQPGPKIDFTCVAPSGAVVGVSVTRAFKGDEHGKVRKFSYRTARTLIAKKLNGLNKAWASIRSEQQWQYGILHVWAPTFRNAVLVENAFRSFLESNSLFVPVALLITSTSFDCPIAFAYIYNHFS